MDKIDKNLVKEFYENTATVWPDNDGWHNINQQEIKKYIAELHLTPELNILNAGSGGNDYGLSISMCHLDIAENKINHKTNYVVGSIESLPFGDGTFDTVICVGSVLNYCDAMLSIGEMSRVLKAGGALILEFENSYSFEYMGSATYKKDVAIANTMYFDKPHKMWVYSEDYIIQLLKNCQFLICDKYRFHILSGMAYRFLKSENAASKYAKLDIILRHMPLLKKHGANIIILSRKT